MREYKFRIWNTDKGYMSRVYTLVDFGSHQRFAYTQGMNGEIEPIDVIMQFTGLSDRNGKEIYEGDICRWGKYKSEIKWQDYMFQFQAKGEDPIMPRSSDMEIIGNVFENKELLK